MHIQECAYAVASASREGAARREAKGVPHAARAAALIVIAASRGVTERFGRGLLNLDLRKLDHPSPLLGFVGDEPSEVSGRA